MVNMLCSYYFACYKLNWQIFSRTLFVAVQHYHSFSAGNVSLSWMATFSYSAVPYHHRLLCTAACLNLPAHPDVGQQRCICTLLVLHCLPAVTTVNATHFPSRSCLFILLIVVQCHSSLSTLHHHLNQIRLLTN